MSMQKRSLLQVLSYLNDDSSDGGGFWLPNIQRSFIWSEQQICRLFDSILRGYPISTFLVWKTKMPVKCRKFIDNFNRSSGISGSFVPKTNNRKCLVLDGQQRLQSLFTGLKGSYQRKELHLDILGTVENIFSPIQRSTDGIMYDFSFVLPESSHAVFPKIRFRDILSSKTRHAADGVIHSAAEKANWVLDDTIRQHISEIVDKIFTVFADTDGITYQELDGTDYYGANEHELFSIDDVTEIFIRTNSGGTKLSKSDLLFSLLSSDWDESNEKMEEFLSVLNRSCYAFNQDFILKTCLVLLDKQAAYNYEKLQDENTRKKISEHWKEITDSISDVVDFIHGKTFIRNDRALLSMNLLIPIVYLRHHYGKKALYDTANEIKEYFIQALLSGAFNYNVDYRIDKLIECINEHKQFILSEILYTIQATLHTLGIGERQLLEIGYKHEALPALFSLWYGADYHPAFAGNAPQIDHIFPQSILKKVTVVNPATGRNIQKYSVAERDQLANCMLLTANENREKTDIPPNEWLRDKSPEYLNLHCIPADIALWEINQFEAFIEERKKLIKQKFSSLLIKNIGDEI